MFVLEKDDTHLVDVAWIL